MNGRQKIEAALSPQGTPEIPAVICYEGIYIRDHWRELTDLPWWYQHAPDIERQLQWRRDVITRTGQDWFYLPTFYPREIRRDLAIEAGPEGVWQVNRRTGARQRLVEPQVGGWSVGGAVESVHPEHLAQTPAALDALLPLPQGNPEALLRDGRADLAQALLAEYGASLYPLCHVSSPMWACYGLWGFEGMMLMIATRPDLVRYACERDLAQSLHQVQMAAGLGAAGIWIEECLTDMIAPAAFEALNLPYVARLVEAIRAAGMQSIYYYCGDPAGKWELLFSAGADALALEESKKGFTIEIEEVVARTQGRCAVLGNLDAIELLPQANEEMLRAEIARQLAAGQRNGSRFVMSLGSPVTPGTPVTRVRRYCDLVHELGGEKG